MFIVKKKNMSETSRMKFLENAWYSTWHIFSTIWGFMIFFEQDWRDNTLEGKYDQIFVGWGSQIIPPRVKEYYLTQLAFWTSCLVYIFVETKRKDFVLNFFDY